MLIRLSFHDGAKELLTLREYDAELDDIGSLLNDLCHAFEGKGTFTISGFGQEVWPVDIGTDLSVALEQFPDLIKSIKSMQPCELWLYEQGTERKLEFTPVNEMYKVRCKSDTTWQPNPDVEIINQSELLHQIIGCRDEFTRFCYLSSPSLKESPWFLEWLTQTR
ncbi:hypothetical protein [Parachitinimonas caeni]|uniref:Uncharacterized protein n=1 Tax=Parachitinimonas caeni TaxID=3031301 RepID=A0ABT7E0U3_9NEIS|nr:hypothetical protein [Parachitinimonas caeni]MDK2125925.1 hypothetical protein [Parachitinimonas caeni]